MIAQLPGPAPARIGGRRVNRHRYQQDPIAYTSRLYHRYGPVAGLVRGDRQQVFAFGAQHNRAVLLDADTFHTVLEYLTPEPIKRARRGIGLLEMNGPRHRRSRRMLAPAFHPRVLAGYRDDIVTMTDAQLSTWRVGAQLDLVDQMRRLTLRIACRTLFGLDIADRSGRVGQLVADMLALPFFAPAVAWFPYDLPGTPYRSLLRTVRALDAELQRMIDRRRAGAGGDLLGLLLALRDERGDPMPDDEIVGQLNTLIVAGHETSSNSLAWALLLLAQHPDVLDALAAELAGTLGGAVPTVADLERLPVLDAVVKETLRLLPPGPNTSRITTAATELGGYSLAAGTVVVTSKYVTHRDPALYPEPSRFRPQRWLDGLTPNTVEYLPFGFGPHVCIGAVLARLEMRLILAMVVPRFRLAIGPGATISRRVGLMMAPRAGIPATVLGPERTPPAHPVRGNIHDMVDLGVGHWDRFGW
ncbi:cytochrome P450 [Nocardia sp. NPDC127579]|uniref:cytochrome P450 n=1 Tax=Nocardia sp. NPDC127579 TaxID=3345402 RepID=UPI0036434083